MKRARRHLEEAIAHDRPDQRCATVFQMGHDLGVGCRQFAALTLWLLGYPAQALVRLQEALAFAHALAQPYSLRWVWICAAVVSHLRRDIPTVHAHAEAAVTRATAQVFHHWAAFGTSLRGWAFAMQGQGE